MPYNFAPTVFTQTNFAAHFLPAKSFFLYGNDKIVAFGGLGATYDTAMFLVSSG